MIFIPILINIGLFISETPRKALAKIIEEALKINGREVMKKYVEAAFWILISPFNQIGKYGDIPTAFNGTPTGNAGFHFVGWDKDVTKPVTFDLVYGGLLADDGQGNQKVGFQATTTIDRTAFNINYDPTGMGIAKDVKFIVNLEFNKAK